MFIDYEIDLIDLFLKERDAVNDQRSLDHFLMWWSELFDDIPNFLNYDLWKDGVLLAKTMTDIQCEEYSEFLKAYVPAGVMMLKLIAKTYGVPTGCAYLQWKGLSPFYK